MVALAIVRPTARVDAAHPTVPAEAFLVVGNQAIACAVATVVPAAGAVSQVVSFPRKFPKCRSARLTRLRSENCVVVLLHFGKAIVLIVVLFCYDPEKEKAPSTAQAGPHHPRGAMGAIQSCIAPPTHLQRALAPRRDILSPCKLLHSYRKFRCGLGDWLLAEQLKDCLYALNMHLSVDQSIRGVSYAVKFERSSARPRFLECDESLTRSGSWQHFSHTFCLCCRQKSTSHLPASPRCGGGLGPPPRRWKALHVGHAVQAD